MTLLLDGLVRLRIEASTARLVLFRPERRNALGAEVLDGLEQAIGLLQHRDDVAVTVLTGQGPTFCAGADLKERGLATSRAERRRLAQRWQELFDSMERLPHPTVAAMQGAAIGGGLLLALTCDIRIGADDLVVRLPEVALGTALSGAGMPRLVREVGLPRARDLVLTGRSVSADEAWTWGLINRVAPVETLSATVEEVVAQMTSGGPEGLRIATLGLRALARGLARFEIAWADAELAADRGTHSDGNRFPSTD